MAPVKKSVKNKADLNKMALKSGATVTEPSGSKFNAAKVKAAPKKRLEKAPAKPPAPAPVVQPMVDDSGARLLAEKIESIGRANVMMLAELKQQISEIQMQSPQPILDWDFEMIRDDKGYLTNIKAHAEIVPPTLN